MEKVRGIIEANKSVSQTLLIGLLNPVIRGWANYHQPARPRRRSTGWTMKSGGHSGIGPDADTPRNHATGSRSTASQPCATELGRLRARRKSKPRTANRLAAPCICGRNQNPATCQIRRIPTRSTLSGRTTRGTCVPQEVRHHTPTSRD